MKQRNGGKWTPEEKAELKAFALTRSHWHATCSEVWAVANNEEHLWRHPTKS
jgi:hypothetical protein